MGTGLLGKKLGMTTLFTEEGAFACTAIHVEPAYVVGIRTKEKEGYEAVVLGFEPTKPQRLNKPQRVFLEKNKLPYLRKIKEFRDMEGNYEIGQQIDIRLFQEGDIVSVTGWTKGRGFSGVVKRHNFSGVGGRTHGQHNRERHPGSMGSNTFPGRVWKGKRLAGRYGNERVAIENLRVLKIIPEKNLLLVSGSVPGPKGGKLIIQK